MSGGREQADASSRLEPINCKEDVTAEIVDRLCRLELEREGVRPTIENLYLVACDLAASFIVENARLMRGGFYRGKYNGGGKS